MASKPYKDGFYRRHAPGSLRSAREVVPLVLELVQPRHVVDVGCGTGTWLSVFRECGVDDVVGIDGDWVDEGTLEIPRECFLAFDLREPLQLEREFDLVVSLEVAEHLAAGCADVFIDSLVALGPVILFSAAIPFQRGTHHVNEQWPDYWAGLFGDRGYAVVDCLRRKVWDNEDVEWHYAQNMLVFARRDGLQRWPLLARELERTSGSQLSLVHPKKLLADVEWWRDALATAAEIATVVPRADAFVLVDHDVYGGEVGPGRHVMPFLERNGHYWGPPADDTTAIRELERLRRAGATFVVFASPAYWWLHYYAELHRYLRSRFPCVLENERVVAFDLRAPAQV